MDLKSSRVSSSVSEKNGSVNTRSSAKKSDIANTLMPKDMQDSVDERNSLKNEVRASSRISDSSSLVMAKDRLGTINEGNCSNHGTVDDSISSSVDGTESSSHTGNLTSNMKNMSSTAKSGNSTNVSARKTNSHTQYKPEKWMLPDKKGDRMTQLNLAIVSLRLNFSLIT